VHAHEHAKPLHNDKVTSLSITMEGDLDLDKVCRGARRRGKGGGEGPGRGGDLLAAAATGLCFVAAGKMTMVCYMCSSP
jgi:hypothetical protein